MSSQRDALRNAITERDAAKEKFRVAGESAECGKQLLRTAQHKLEQFGDVDGAILKHRAASFKSAAQGGPKPSLALPDELVRRERARDEAASAVAAARAAHASLGGELAAAETALQRAEFKVSETAKEVLAAGAIEPGQALTDIWNNLWATIDSLNALRASLHVKLPPNIVRTLESFGAMDHRMFAGGHNAQLAKAVQHWKRYHNALLADSTASEPIGDDDDSPVVVAERVA